MATVEKWNPFGVALNVTATSGGVTRKSATQYTVKINASWETYYDGNKTLYGMTASSGGGSATINPFGTKAENGSGTFTGTYSISGNGSATKTVTVTFKNFNSDNGDSATKTVSFNVTVPAWTSYTVSYNANGGSGAPSAQTKWKDQTLTLSSTKPTRSGYTFVGWGTSATDTTSNYSAGGSYTSNASITLYAIWKKTLTLTYNANSGSGAPSSQSATIYNATTNYKFTLSSTKPTRSGYTFLGWSTSSTATSASYSAGGTITISANTTLYAVWKLITYTIKYNANGGTGAPSSQIKTHGTALTLSSTKPTRTSIESNGTITEYIFKGWATSSTATSVAYKAGSSYTSNANATLYAVWGTTTTSARYDVSYNTNGGSDVIAQIKNKGETLVLRDTIPVKSGYTFKGWGLSADTTTVSYTVGANYTADDDIVLYAIWEPWSHTVTFNLNGGSGEVPSNFTATTDEDVLIPNIIPAKEYSVFRYWCTKQSGSGGTKYYIGDGYDTLKNGGTVTLYAIWGEKIISFKNDSTVYATEFVEGESLNLNGLLFGVAELIEK